MKELNRSIKSLKETYLSVCQWLGAAKFAPSQAQMQLALFAFGVVVLSLGLSHSSFAQDDILEDHTTHYNDIRIAEAVTAILTYIEGSFGALVMVGSGIAAILSSAFGQYRAALGCLVVAVGAFILRSVMSTFFNTTTIDGDIVN